MDEDNRHPKNRVNMSIQDKWNRIYKDRSSFDTIPKPAQVLIDHSYLLPRSGRSVDMACGKGGNALFLAELGYDSSAWDIADVALEQLSVQSERLDLQVNTRVLDIENEQLPSNDYDVIVVSYFLNRSICEQIKSMLVSGGLLFYQTFTVDSQKIDYGPNNPDYLLKPNELLRLFDGMHVHAYREGGLVENSVDNSLQAQAYLVARKT